VELTTDQRGAIAEAAIIHAAIKLGVGVYRPLVNGGRYDLLFEAGRDLLRVQCKAATCYGDVVVVRCRSSRRTRDGQIQRPYTLEEIDVIAAHCPELERSFYIPFAEATRRSSIQLRLTPTRNNQKKGVLWADEYSLEARLRELAGP
jgi:PD-(D/E)XK endonuclease